MNEKTVCPGSSRSAVYEIRVLGKLDASWQVWLNDMTITRETAGPDANTADPIIVLRGPVADQAALRGLLVRLWDLNLTVLSVRYEGPEGG